MENDRIKNAKRALATLEGDARARVSVAAKILSKIHQRELAPELFEKIQTIVYLSTRFPPLQANNGSILRDSYAETARKSRNSTAVKIAEKIYDL